MLWRLFWVTFLVFALAACGSEQSRTDNGNGFNVGEPDGDDDGDGDSDGDTDNDGDNDPDCPGGSCDSLTSCLRNADCADDEYCDREPGCGEEGVCRFRPDPDCDDAETSYCDCEGESQLSPNTCIWEPYAHLGECQDVSPVSCESNEDCSEPGQYCEREPGCGTPGVCADIPNVGCGDAMTPYCDCDGNVQEWPDTCVHTPYMNLGECVSGGMPEGCESNDDCPEAGQYCEREPGCQARGVCTDIPQDASCLMVITPYCDCDGNQQESMDSCIWEPYQSLGQCPQ